MVWPADAGLAGELESRGGRVVSGPEDVGSGRDSWREAFAGLPEGQLAGVVHLGALTGCGAEASSSALGEDVERSGRSALALVQGLLDAGVSPRTGVWLVTRGGQAVSGERGGELAGSALWGFGRTVARELPEVPLRLLDLDPATPADPQRLAGELFSPDGETQVAWRGGRRLAARLIRSGGRTGSRVELPAGGRWRLVRDSGGGLSALRAEPVSLPAPGSGEVRVAVEAAGLNFLDVMSGMGLVEVEAPLGVEFCGRVLEVGAEVEGVSAGERVVGFGAGAFGPEVVTRAELAVPAPGEHSASALATVPVAFVTAALAFEWADLSPGDAVLVHAGSGGVGHAAIQWARAAGLVVYATASAGEAGARARVGGGGGVRQPERGLRGGGAFGDGGRGSPDGAEQPDGGGFHRGEPFVPWGGGPLRGAREAGDLG